MGPGDTVGGRFQLVEHIAVGGMGVVFRAVDQTTRQAVALKLLEGRTATEIERARREAEVLARLSHPGIVRHVADGVLPDGKLFLAMEWIDGVTVGQRIADTGFSLREALVVVRRLADALASAHRAGILHRDLKPSNILLPAGDPAAPRLIDFGVARLRDSVHALTRAGAAIGTPGYMSPEQARGERTLGPACDVFGLGCVLYECATGTPAFSGTAAAAVMAKILFAEPAPLASLCPEAPRALVVVLERMLAKPVRDRLPDCAAVVAEIDALGVLPDGPRRTSRRLVADDTQVEAPRTAVHFLVAASQGSADDMLPPPTPEQAEQLAKAAGAWDARLELLATGAVIAHVTGDPADASHRAARLALAIRRILAGWSLAISAGCADPGAAAEQGSELVTRTAMAAIFRPETREAIALDPSTAEQLAEEFELGSDRGDATLIGEK